MRCFSTSARHCAGRLFPALKTPEQISTYIHTSHGSLRDLMPRPGNHVDGATVRKMLRLSGFETNVSEETGQKWADALNVQVGFIDHVNDDSNATRADLPVFRPLPSDHHSTPALSLQELQKLVQEYQSTHEEPWEATAYIKDTVKL